MASIGLAPQDLKYKGERTRLTIGTRQHLPRVRHHQPRHARAAAARPRIGDGNLFMAYVHVAHDCHIGNATIFGPRRHARRPRRWSRTTRRSAPYSGVHQFCRVGRHAFIGGYSVVTKDALPFGKYGRQPPARIFGLNTIGLARRGFTPDTISQLKRAYRYLLPSKLNTSRALAADRAGSGAHVAGGAVPRRLHPHARSAASSCGGRRVAPRSWSPTNEAGGLIAGNGRFPFLVLDAARAQGHDVTIIAAKEEAFPELNEAAAPPRRGDPLDLARPAGQVHQRC